MRSAPDSGRERLSHQPGARSRPAAEECLLEDNDARNKIAVVTVDGIITDNAKDQAGNNMVDVIKAQLDRAKEDDRVKAVILKVDSPGGEVLASDEINKVIAKFQMDAPGRAGRSSGASRWFVRWAAWRLRAAITFPRPAAGLWRTR